VILNNKSFITIPIMLLLLSNPLLIWFAIIDGGSIILVLFSNFVFLFYCYYKQGSPELEQIKKLLVITKKSPLEKLKRFHLCVFILIPNLVLINNGISLLAKIFLSLLLMFLGSLFSVFYLIFICHTSFAFFSFIFGYLYEKSNWFSNRVDRFYFKDKSQLEINLIWNFFFGNMYKAGKFALGAAAGGGFYGFKKRDEITVAYAEAYVRVSANPHPPTTFEGFDEAVKAQQQYILDKETLIHTAEFKANLFVFGPPL
jgi:hypothetical protein